MNCFTIGVFMWQDSKDLACKAQKGFASSVEIIGKIYKDLVYKA